MKKYLLSLPVLFVAFILLSISSCELFDFLEDDPCKEDEMPRISKTFLPKVVIKYKDGVAFDGKTEYYIVKERCDGSQSGYMTASGTPDQAGKYEPNLEPLYSYNNKQDKVFFQFTAYHTPYYPAVETTETVGEVFNYEKAQSQSDEYDEIIKTYYITIPTNSDGTN